MWGQKTTQREWSYGSEQQRLHESNRIDCHEPGEVIINQERREVLILGNMLLKMILSQLKRFLTLLLNYLHTSLQCSEMPSLFLCI